MPSRAGLGMYGEESGELVGFEDFDDGFEDFEMFCSICDAIVSL